MHLRNLHSLGTGRQVIPDQPGTIRFAFVLSIGLLQPTDVFRLGPMFTAVSAVIAAGLFVFALAQNTAPRRESFSYFAVSFVFILVAVFQWFSSRTSRRPFKNRILAFVLRSFVLISGLSVSLIAVSVFVLVYDLAGSLLAACLFLGTLAAIGFAYAISYFVRGAQPSESQCVINIESVPLLLAHTQHARKLHLRPSNPRPYSTRNRIEKARQRITSLAYFLTGVDKDRSSAH